MRTVSIAQTKPSGRARITELLDQLPWTWHWSKTCATISCKQLYDYMQHECPGLHHEKKVPQWIKDADKEVIAAFLNGAIAGDGWIQNGYRNFASTSKRLADDVTELFFKLGGSPSVTLRLIDGWKIAGRSGEITLPQYHVRENKGRKSAALDGKGRQFMVKARDYNGMVYCATVPNGTLVVRRAGKMIVAGNCHVYCRAAAAAAGLDRFEERHWLELKKQLGIEPENKPARIQVFDPAQATQVGGLNHSGSQKSVRRVIKSRWLSS